MDMDTVCLDDWELLPDQASSFSMKEYCGNGHGGVGVGKEKDQQLLLGAELVMVDMDHFAAADASHPRGPCYGCILGEDAEKPLFLPPSSPPDVHGSVPVITEFKDIGVVHTEFKRMASMPKVTEILISDAEEEVIEFPDDDDDGVKEVVRDEVLAVAAEAASAAAPGRRHQFAGEEDEDEGANKKIGFSVGNLRVRGAGALCSFGVAAATFCIFLLGGKQQQQHRNKIQLQMYADDQQRIQQVMRQASRLNQTMPSSVMGGASSSPRASISFGGHYHGF